MGFFDRFRKSKPSATAALQPQGRCTKYVVLEASCSAESSGAEGWFFTLSEEGQKRLLEEQARRGLAAARERFPDQVAIDLERWPRHCMFFNGMMDGKRKSIARLMFYADPAVAEPAARAAFDGAAGHLHALHRAAG